MSNKYPFEPAAAVAAPTAAFDAAAAGETEGHPDLSREAVEQADPGSACCPAARAAKLRCAARKGEATGAEGADASEADCLLSQPEAAASAAASL